MCSTRGLGYCGLWCVRWELCFTHTRCPRDVGIGAHENRLVPRYEAELAAEAVAAVQEDQKDPRPQALIRVEGHLFDKGVLNRLMDIAVDSPCDFEVCCSIPY